MRLLRACLATHRWQRGALAPLREPRAAPAHLARPRRPNAQVSVAVLQSLEAARGLVHDDVVLASALRAPAHRVLACKLDVYGTPFEAPALQDLDGAPSLTDLDKEVRLRGHAPARCSM